MRKIQRSNERRQIVLHGVTRVYDLKRSAGRTTLALSINGQGLVVHAPWNLPMAQIEGFVQDKASWIAAKLATHSLSDSSKQVWEEWMQLLYLGEKITLRMLDHAKSVFLKNDVLYVPRLPDQDLKSTVVAWYQSSALSYFNIRLEQFSTRLTRQPSQLKLSRARTRWGSCTQEGIVRLNWRLIQASNAEIDYVLAHELAHLTQMNHSARFWQEVQRLYPGFQTPHKLLRQHGPQYYRIS